MCSHESTSFLHGRWDSVRLELGFLGLHSTLPLMVNPKMSISTYFRAFLPFWIIKKKPILITGKEMWQLLWCKWFILSLVLSLPSFFYFLANHTCICPFLKLSNLDVHTTKLTLFSLQSLSWEWHFSGFPLPYSAYATTLVRWLMPLFISLKTRALPLTPWNERGRQRFDPSLLVSLLSLVDTVLWD